MKIKDMIVEDLAVYISDFLRRNGIETVLSGGACVSIYSDNKYVSYDLDFVLLTHVSQKKIEKTLLKIDFHLEGKYFKHEETQYYIDFISPPLSVGDEPVKEILEIKKKGKVLKLISPTDCVKDRLAAYYHWNDRQSKEQAILVCKNNSVDLKEVKRWSNNERMEEKFRIFQDELNKISV